MARMKESTVPVVVVGGSLNGLGVVRSLSSGGMPITVVESTRRCPAAWSKHCRFVSVPSLEGRDLVDGLKKIATEMGQKPVLILTDDRAVETVSKFRDELSEDFLFHMPSADRVDQLADKTLFHSLAEQAGLPVPRSTIISNSSDIEKLTNLTFPVVIKPANKSLALNGQVAGTSRAETLEIGRELAKEMLAQAGSLIAQEWIVGPDTEIYFTLFVCDANSQLTALFSGRKVVCNPPNVGNTAVCVSADEHADELKAHTEKFISLVRYQGIGSMEYKRDTRTGRFTIVEPTVGRTDWQEEIATLCGVNIPLIAYQSVLGQASAFEPSAVLPFAWRSSNIFKAPKGEITQGTEIIDGYFRANDLMPALYYYGYERVIGRALRLFGYGFRSLSGKNLATPLLGKKTEKAI